MQPTEETLRLRVSAMQFEREVQRFLCPIYGVNGAIGKSIGSGFLLQLSSATLLVTAAHVLHEMHSCVLHTIGATRVVPIEGKPYSTGPPLPKQRPDFGPDIGFVVLNESAMQERPSVARLCPHDLDPNDVPSEGTAYGFVGIPGSENKASNQVFDGTSYFYGGLPAPDEIYRLLGYERTTHFAMRFERDALIDESSQVVQVPDPHGMSGGPVFRLGRFDEIASGEARPKVIGVMIEWWESREVLVAIRASAVVDCIRQLLPQFASELPAPRYIEGTVALL
jgi:hypothetical protein